jgi:magnesium chelatase family protein
MAYRQRLSGPMLDRLDIQLAVPRLTKAELLGSQAGERSADVRDRVEAARERQRRRLNGTTWTSNAQMPGALARREGRLTPDAEGVLSVAVERLALSGRGFDRAVKVARTIADLAGADRVEGGHVAEALGYRELWRGEEVAQVG